MKKKLFLVAIFVILLVISSHSVFAMEEGAVSPIITIENKEVQYDLPYPGLLPDNPLYPFKVFRDRVVAFFISDPVKKADDALLQADKRMNASIYLANEKKVNEDLISSTMSKAINYFEQTIVEVKLAKEQGADMKSFVQRMDTASQKYHTVILQLKTKASDKLKNDFLADQKRLDTGETAIKKMEKK